MKPRRRMIFIAALVLLALGLCLIGPAHHALHGDHGLGHANGPLDSAPADGGGTYCDGCVISSVESPTAFTLSGIVPDACERFDPSLVRAPSAEPPLFHSPRGPPASV